MQLRLHDRVSDDRARPFDGEPAGDSPEAYPTMVLQRVIVDEPAPLG